MTLAVHKVLRRATIWTCLSSFCVKPASNAHADKSTCAYWRHPKLFPLLHFLDLSRCLQICDPAVVQRRSVRPRLLIMYSSHPWPHTSPHIGLHPSTQGQKTETRPHHYALHPPTIFGFVLNYT